MSADWVLIVGFENLKFPWQSEIPTECIQYTRGIAGELVDDGGYNLQQVSAGGDPGCYREPQSMSKDRRPPIISV